MPHTVLLELRFKPGMGTTVLPGVLESLKDTRAYQGCQLVETYVDAEDPDHVFLWEKWGARSDQEAYMNWRVETGTTAAMAEVMAEPPTVVHLAAAD